MRQIIEPELRRWVYGGGKVPLGLVARHGSSAPDPAIHARLIGTG